MCPVPTWPPIAGHLAGQRQPGDIPLAQAHGPDVGTA
jgi:hypothetical protein